MDEAKFKAAVKTLKFHKDVTRIAVAGNAVEVFWKNEKNAERSFSAPLSASTQALDSAGAPFAEAAAKDFVTLWDVKKAERKDKKDKEKSKK